jgi:hypothetical protein
MGILEEEAQLHFHGVPSAAVDDLPLACVALGVVLQELHHLCSHGLVHAAGHAHVQEDLHPITKLLSAMLHISFPFFTTDIAITNILLPLICNFVIIITGMCSITAEMTIETNAVHTQV